jgi:ABC-2 type transport system ATP-binding protein
MLVYDYLDYVAGLRGVDRSKRLDRIRAMADMCALNEVMHQPVAELSKGYKQRVGLAHALINDPEVLVLDEPTSGLDPNQIVEIRDIIKRIGQEKTIIFSTHILSEAEATCDRIVIIDKGGIVADESTGALKQKASRDYYIHLTLTGAGLEAVRSLLADVREVSEIRETPAPEADPAADEFRLQLRCRAGSDPRREIYSRIRRQDWGLLEFYSETPSLENIFRKLTRES